MRNRNKREAERQRQRTENSIETGRQVDRERQRESWTRPRAQVGVLLLELFVDGVEVCLRLFSLSPPLSFTSLSLSLSFSSSAKSIREFRSASCEFPGAKHRSGISEFEEHLGLLVNGLEMRLRLRLCCWLFLCPTLSVLEHACVRVCLCPTTPTPTQTQTHTDACRCRFVGVCVYSCPALCV